MRGLVVGMGSIGVRHHRILSELELTLKTVSSHSQSIHNYPSISDALKHWDPGYVVIASETHHHLTHLNELLAANFLGKALIEKPVLATSKSVPLTGNLEVYVGYNLRFHPVVQELSRRILGERILSVNVYVGSNLEIWRTNRPYQESYSIDRMKGGGVLRDLSHELDLIQWLFGSWQGVTAQTQKMSARLGDAEDMSQVLMRLESGALVSLELNSLDRNHQRVFQIQTDSGSFRADLVNAELRTPDEILRFPHSPDESYRIMHQMVLSDNSTNVCRFDTAVGIVRLVEAIEKASSQQAWYFSENKINETTVHNLRS